MGDVGGAECDLGGGVVEGGRSTVTVRSGDGSGRDGVASDESIFERVNPSSRLGDSDR
jgi:hypothetical protein